MKGELWNPFEDMKNLRKSMDDMFKDFWSKNKELLKSLDIKQPSVDIRDKKDKVEVVADIPGVDKRDIDVTAFPDRLEIKAEKKKKAEVKKKDLYRQERAYSGFYRMVSLPAMVNPDKAKTSFKNGVLTVILPKVKELPKKSKKLAIK